jgi:hypothetical protein
MRHRTRLTIDIARVRIFFNGLLLSASTTEAPASAKAFAIASPTPELAPVTSATLLSKDKSMI